MILNFEVVTGEPAFYFVGDSMMIQGRDKNPEPAQRRIYEGYKKTHPVIGQLMTYAICKWAKGSKLRDMYIELLKLVADIGGIDAWRRNTTIVVLFTAFNASLSGLVPSVHTSSCSYFDSSQD